MERMKSFPLILMLVGACSGVERSHRDAGEQDDAAVVEDATPGVQDAIAAAHDGTAGIHDTAALSGDLPATDGGQTVDVATPVDLFDPTPDLAGGVAAAICGSGGFCWENPLPQGNRLFKVWVGGANDAWAVGDHGTILRWNGVALTRYDSGTIADLTDISFASSTDGWIVGGGGTVLRWNGTAWSAASTPAPAVALVGVSAFGGEVWIFPAAGDALHWSAGSWSTVSIAPLTSVAATYTSGAGDIWLANATGSTVHLESGAFVARGSSLNPVTAIWGSGSDAYVGSNGTDVAYWNGSTWGALPVLPSYTYALGGWSSGPSHVVVAGTSGALRHFDGANWSAPLVTALHPDLEDVGGHGVDVFAVGEGGSVFQSKTSGQSFSRLTSGETRAFVGIAGIDTNDLWAVDAFGDVYRRQGTAMWNGPLPAGQSSPNAIAVGDVVWIAGALGKVTRFDGSGFSAAPSTGTTKPFYGAWAQGAAAFVVGDSYIMRWNGSGWTSEYNNPATNLYGIGGPSPTDLWAVGLTGTMLHRGANGAWSAVTSMTSARLTAVWSLEGHVVAVGRDGTILRYDGTTWHNESQPGYGNLTAVGGTGPNDLWITGEFGTLLRNTGSGWSAYVASTSNTLTGILALDGHVWLAGRSGTILRR